MGRFSAHLTRHDSSGLPFPKRVLPTRTSEVRVDTDGPARAMSCERIRGCWTDPAPWQCRLDAGCSLWYKD